MGYKAGATAGHPPFPDLLLPTAQGGLFPQLSTGMGFWLIAVGPGWLHHFPRDLAFRQGRETDVCCVGQDDRDDGAWGWQTAFPRLWPLQSVRQGSMIGSTSRHKGRDTPKALVHGQCLAD